MAVLILLAVFTACSPIDNRSTNKAIARNYIEMLETKAKIGRWELYFADPVKLNGNEMSRRALMRLAERMFSQYADLQATIQDQIAEGDTVVTRVIFEGTKLNDASGTPPSRKKVRIMAIAIDRFKGDKVIEMWHTTEDLDVR
jgi:predicted ester cyclase